MSFTEMGQHSRPRQIPRRSKWLPALLSFRHLPSTLKNPKVQVGCVQLSYAPCKQNMYAVILQKHTKMDLNGLYKKWTRHISKVPKEVQAGPERKLGESYGPTMFGFPVCRKESSIVLKTISTFR